MASTHINHRLWLRGLLVAMTVCCAPLFADAPTTTETRDLSGFTAVKLTGAGDASLREGEDFVVEITGPADLMDKVRTRVRNETLEISFEGRNWLGGNDSDELHFNITMPRIDGVHVTGAGDVDVGPLVTKNLAVSVTGSGDVLMENATAKALSLSVTGSGNIEIKQLEAIEATATISGSGDIEVSGEVHRQTISIMGSGDFNGENLNADTASGTIMGSGDIDMGRVKQHSFRQTGSGSVNLANGGDTLSYRGNTGNGSFSLPVGEGRRGVM